MLFTPFTPYNAFYPAPASVELSAPETRPKLSCLSCTIVCLSAPISSAISRIVASLSAIIASNLSSIPVLSFCGRVVVLLKVAVCMLIISPLPVKSHSEDRFSHFISQIVLQFAKDDLYLPRVQSVNTAPKLQKKA